MGKITFDYSKALGFVDRQQILDMQERVSQCHDMLHKGTGSGSDYLGWVDLPNNYDAEEFERIKAAAEKIRNQSDVFIVIGIGGSYLGARAAVGMLNHSFYNELPKDKRNGPRVYFAGYNISSTYLKNLLDILDGQDISINVISKSGTTMETTLAFTVLRGYMENKYGKDEAARRIYATTDKSKGALKELADREGYETFVVPDDIAGRYSVLTPVGLLPMAAAGIDIDEVMRGAGAATVDLAVEDIEHNPCYQYAVIRNLLYSKGK
ncbi:MAG TPA: glucose-6-phosphate isomerase, partial [Thermoanaerobacterales bacterium]|nr:glucose-6-phosphate isomerase [Thermoanaerobacterales bacterium]